MANLSELESKLQIGEEKARKVAFGVLDRVRKKLGYR
jgi:tryptophanyl-tRNA synthetase